MFLHLRFDEWSAASESDRVRLSRAVHDAFSCGQALYITDFRSLGTSIPQLHAELFKIRTYLERQPVVAGFAGLDKKPAQRRTLGTIHRYGSDRLDFDYMESQLDRTDGDLQTYRTSLQVLRTEPGLVTAMNHPTRVAAHVLEALMRMMQITFRIPEQTFAEIVRGSTFRHRAILYDGQVRDSTCGVHPDGNMLSVLFTDASGFRAFDADWHIHEPDPDGVIVLPGSLLWRWTQERYKPVFHYVRDVVGSSKTSCVYFYNLEIDRSFPCLSTEGSTRMYVNDINRYKLEDIDPRGPFGSTFDRILANVDYDPAPSRAWNGPASSRALDNGAPGS